MKYKILPRPEKWIILGIPFLFLAGACLHFTYELTGKSFIVGIFSPVNESVWEHCKMVVLLTILWWSVYYICKSKSHSIDKNKWFSGALVSVFVSIITIPLFFYFYTEAFGIESLIIDILLLLFANFLGQLTGLHVYKYGKGINYIVAICLLAAIFIAFAVFTIFPPALPIFAAP
ncbi:MAG: hypothetical protein EOM30_12345 [Clostridia bacterium]|nr:hypothetical protein [Clostridia bacterium]NLS84317.1 hypothetical protein [Oscillospiraceae bacterium]